MLVSELIKELEACDGSLPVYLCDIRLSEIYEIIPEVDASLGDKIEINFVTEPISKYIKR